jgi:hypothetical protein
VSPREPGRRRLDGHRLAAQGRLVDGETCGRRQPSVRRHPFALAEQHQIAKNQLLDRELAHSPRANDARALLQHVTESQHGPLGPRLLDEAEERVQEHDRSDGSRLDPLADEEGNNGSTDQEPN